jgi:hypothetical protein
MVFYARKVLFLKVVEVVRTSIISVKNHGGCLLILIV